MEPGRVTTGKTKIWKTGIVVLVFFLKKKRERVLVKEEEMSVFEKRIFDLPGDKPNRS